MISARAYAQHGRDGIGDPGHLFPGRLTCGVVGIGIADVVLLCTQKGLQYGRDRRGIGRVIQINHGLPPMAVRSFTTSPAMISPTTEGTKALLPGTCRRWVHFRSVPGGQMQLVR